MGERDATAARQACCPGWSLRFPAGDGVRALGDGLLAYGVPALLPGWSVVGACPPPVVSTCWGPRDLALTWMRRGLACSATGIVRVRTPWSQLASSRPASRLSPRNS